MCRWSVVSRGESDWELAKMDWISGGWVQWVAESRAGGVTGIKTE